MRSSSNMYGLFSLLLSIEPLCGLGCYPEISHLSHSIWNRIHHFHDHLGIYRRREWIRRYAFIIYMGIQFHWVLILFVCLGCCHCAFWIRSVCGVCTVCLLYYHNIITPDNCSNGSSELDISIAPRTGVRIGKKLWCIMWVLWCYWPLF